MEERETRLARTVPGLARIAVAAYWRSARWTVRASAQAGRRVIRAAVTGQEPGELFRSTEAELRERMRRLLGIRDDRPEERAAMTPDAAAADDARARDSATRQALARQSLRERGEELLRRSADVNFEEDSHPAYARILDELAPDEARILRLLAEQGPQPSVDVRSGLLPLQSTTELIAAGLNTIGSEAGCRHHDDVFAYLNNLNRLGLIWFSREPLPDPLRYQVLEAQPEVTEALGSASRTRTIRRSIHLTPFGRDFCELCLPGEVREPDAAQDRDGPGGVEPPD